MRLLMTIGYEQWLLPEGADAAAVVAAMAGAIPVKEEGPWDTRVLVQDEKREVNFKLVANTAPSLPGNSTAEVEKLVQLAKENLTLTAEVARLKKAVVA